MELPGRVSGGVRDAAAAVEWEPPSGEGSVRGAAMDVRDVAAGHALALEILALAEAVRIRDVEI